MSNKETKDVTPNQSNGNMNDKQAMSALKQNAGNIVTTIAVVLAGYFGWTYFQNNKPVSYDTVASDKFSKVQELNQQSSIANNLGMELPEEMKAQFAKSQETMNASIDGLVAEHGDSIYTWQALMMKARNQTDAGDYTSASETLKSATEMDIEDSGLQSIAQIRYAQALLADKELDTALVVASNEIPESFEASKQEVLGDIYLAKNDKDSAIRSYENAWQLLSKRQENRRILALKMETLGIEFEPITEALVISLPKQQSEKPSEKKSADVGTSDNKPQNQASASNESEVNNESAESK